MATSDDHKYAAEITEEMALSAAKRGVAVSRRTPDYVTDKIDAGLAVIAVNPETGEWTGFCYVEVWQHQKYVANSGLIVSPKYRGLGISKEIKLKLFELCRAKFPQAKLFSLSTSQAVMHVNGELGYKTVPFSDILKDTLFLKGCNSWVNYVDLMTRDNGHSHYVAMVYDPAHAGKESALSHPRHYVVKKIRLLKKKKTPELVLIDYAVNRL